MEVKPYGIYVSVSYPPDTDTPGELYDLCAYMYECHAGVYSGSVLMLVLQMLCFICLLEVV